MMRSEIKDVINGIENAPFAFGSLGGTTNINTRATNYAAGTNVNAAYTNRAYKLRGQAIYSTGIMDNGWAFTGSVVYRWADEGRTEGTFYNSFGYFLAAEKVLGDHRFALTTFVHDQTGTVSCRFTGGLRLSGNLLQSLLGIPRRRKA